MLFFKGSAEGKCEILERRWSFLGVFKRIPNIKMLLFLIIYHKLFVKYYLIWKNVKYNFVILTN